ncbi:hypothetical protein [Streptomyces sp. 2A115]|uniref:hypothetical protein n=1 Tax=Streptomyces sp. 2A115 TaxID=3457439 RepID=UPI003FD161D1
MTDSRGRTGLLDKFTGSTFRLVIRHGTDAASAESAVRAHRAEGGFPIRVVRLVAETPAG